MNFSKHISINAPAEEVWDMFGRDFANIGKWATSVSESAANLDLPKVNGSPVGGRTCDTSFGKISEEFTAYDDATKTFGFKGVFKSVMFESIVNQAEVNSTGDSSATVKITPRVELSFLGSLISTSPRFLSSTLGSRLKAPG